MFSENQFCLLSVWVLLRPIAWVFLSENFTRHSSLCVLNFGWDLIPRFVHNIFNKFLFITARVEKKVRLCVKLFDFFPRWILIRLTWNLWRFVPNSVQILTWNFRKKLFWDNFYWNLFKNQGYPLPKFVKFRPTFCNFILCWEIALKNSHKYFHVLLAPSEAGTSINK